MPPPAHGRQALGPNSRYLAIGLAATAVVGAGALLYYRASFATTTRAARLTRHGVRGPSPFWALLNCSPWPLKATEPASAACAGAEPGRLQIQPSQYPQVGAAGVISSRLTQDGS